jgi:mono/diheme cytochrome c family protein
MRKFLKWLGIILGGLIGLLLITALTLFIIGGSRVNKSYDIEPAAVATHNNDEVLARGKYLTAITCAGCHGDNLAGTLFFDDPAIGSFPAPNLTAGQGGAAAGYSDTDFVRAIRHGVNSSGKPLLIMPSTAFWHYSDEDLAAIIAYIKSAPPVDNDLGPRKIRPLGRILFATGAFGELSADVIDHNAQRPAAPEAAVSTAYGEYLVNTGDCRLCHGPNLSGAAGAAPGSPPGPNLTPGGELAGWTAEDFINTMRTGTTPAGHKLNPEYMPWRDIGRMTDEDLTAVFLYLQFLPAQETTTQ